MIIVSTLAFPPYTPRAPHTLPARHGVFCGTNTSTSTSISTSIITTIGDGDGSRRVGDSTTGTGIVDPDGCGDRL